MNLLALLEDPDGASARLRFEPFARALVTAGHEVERVAIPPSGPRRWRVLVRARDFDAVFLQRRLLQPWESALLRGRARRIVVDVDDAIWRRDHAPYESITRRLRARALLRRADVVLAGSQTLADELRSIGVRSEAWPTPLPEVSSPRAAPRARAHPPTLSWIGQPATWRYMRELAPAWAQIRRARADARLLAIGSGVASDADFPGAEHRTWTLSGEADALAESDIGLAPLPDDPWSRGKCAARLLTYLSAGVVAVASPVGAQRELAEEVGGVVLARSPGEFAEATIGLLADPAARRRRIEGVSACLTLRRSLERLAPRFLAHLLGEGGSRAGSAVSRVAGPERVE